jgi:lipopolysaccharide export system permease protein
MTPGFFTLKGRFNFLSGLRLGILDRYIFLQFIQSFLFIVLNFTLVICMIDLVEKNDDFINNKPGLYRIIFNYYLNFIPYMANLLSPITVFITTVFVTSRLASRTEIIAMLNSGMSFARILFPFLLAASLIGTIIFFLVAYIIPNCNKTRLAFEYQYVNSPFVFGERNFHLRIGPTTYFYVESYNNESHEGNRCTLEDIKGTELHIKLTADRMAWQPENRKWRLFNVRITDLRQFPTAPVKIPVLDTTLSLNPSDFENQHLMHERMTNPELNRHIATLTLRGADDVETYKVEKYLRFTYPFSIVILTLIGVILSARKSREGSGVKIALGFALAFVYIVFHIVSRTIAQAGEMDPLLACWMPNLLFMTIGALLYRYVPT